MGGTPTCVRVSPCSFPCCYSSISVTACQQARAQATYAYPLGLKTRGLRRAQALPCHPERSEGSLRKCLQTLRNETKRAYRIVERVTIRPFVLSCCYLSLPLMLAIARGICPSKSEASNPVSPISALTSSEAAVCR